MAGPTATSQHNDDECQQHQSRDGPQGDKEEETWRMKIMLDSATH